MRQHNEVDGYCGPELAELNEYLATRHGLCFMGFPTYRVVLSSHAWQLSGGEWHDWDENIPTELRGRMVANETGRGLTPESRSLRVVTEVRRRHKYAEHNDNPGWMLERWMAPAYFGTPTWWESQVVPGTDVPRLGPYPYQGEYILVEGPYPEAPTGPFFDQLVEQWELMRDEVLAYRADTWIAKRDQDAHREDDERNARWNRDASDANMTAMQSFASTFLEGGLARQIAADHQGLNSHYGN
jgi:hypothetical protein